MCRAGSGVAHTIDATPRFRGDHGKNLARNTPMATPLRRIPARRPRRASRLCATMAGMRSPPRGPRSTQRSTADPRLDDISKSIIEVLQVDGRASYAAIAKEDGLSEAAVRQRVQRLLDAGIMQIVAVTDPIQVGFRRQAMIGLRVSGDLA